MFFQEPFANALSSGVGHRNARGSQTRHDRTDGHGLRRETDGSDHPEARRVAGRGAGAGGRQAVVVAARPEPRRSASHAGDRTDRRSPGAVGRRPGHPDTVGRPGRSDTIGRRRRPETVAAHRCGAAAYSGRRVRGRLVFAPFADGDADVLRRAVAAAGSTSADRPATAPTTAAGPGAATAAAPAPAATAPAAPAAAPAGRIRRQPPVARL